MDEPNIAVIIVCYHPDNKKLLNLVHAVTSEKSIIYVANNGGMERSLIENLEKKDISVTTFNNVGLGKAINEIAETLPESAQIIFTFDQDSAPPDGFITNVWHHYQSLQDSDCQLGVLTPKFIDSRSGFEYSLDTINQSNKYSELLITLQSGMCIPKKVWEKEKFNNDLFIEFVDTEWCYRIHSKGYKILQMNDVVMHHEVSDLAPKEFFKFKLLKYSPIRRYYFFRNAIFLLKQNYVPLYNKLRLLTGMGNRCMSILLLDDKKISSLTNSFKGIWHGIWMSNRKVK
ncbi:glycosyltransferase [Enterobacteriaceae bacterium RIT693]|nr:glycosyltransferase [Enterobacteriaceae bacterium RIT693]